MAFQKVTIGSAVGRMPALNALKDQSAIIGLLNLIRKGPGAKPVPAPQRAGVASADLIQAIVDFQSAHVEPRFRDGRVDPGGTTLAKLNAVAADPNSGLEKGVASLQVRYEELTQEHIKRALRAHQNKPERQRLFRAFEMIAKERNAKDIYGNPINCGDRPLAYADHYLLSRFVVACGSAGPIGGRSVAFAGMTVAVLGYDLVKLINFAIFFMQTWEAKWPEATGYREWLFGLALKTGECPMSTNLPDTESTRWGMRGAAAGLWELHGDPTF